MELPDGWPTGKFGVIYLDPPWHFKTYSDKGRDRSPKYRTMSMDQIALLPVCELALPDCVMLMWGTWPMLPQVLRLIEAYDFTYKTCGFDWMKADVRQVDLFREDADADMKSGYWTRSNTEPCLLATRGHPKRKNADVRMGIIEKAREHSRKPDCVYSRIERLVDGPYVELFSRTTRPGWTSWGDDVGFFPPVTA